MHEKSSQTYIFFFEHARLYYFRYYPRTAVFFLHLVGGGGGECGEKSRRSVTGQGWGMETSPGRKPSQIAAVPIRRQGQVQTFEAPIKKVQIVRGIVEVIGLPYLATDPRLALLVTQESEYDLAHQISAFTNITPRPVCVTACLAGLAAPYTS